MVLDESVCIFCWILPWLSQIEHSLTEPLHDPKIGRVRPVHLWFCSKIWRIEHSVHSPFTLDCLWPSQSCRIDHPVRLWCIHIWQRERSVVCGPLKPIVSKALKLPFVHSHLMHRIFYCPFTFDASNTFVCSPFTFGTSITFVCGPFTFDHRILSLLSVVHSHLTHRTLLSVAHSHLTHRTLLSIHIWHIEHCCL